MQVQVHLPRAGSLLARWLPALYRPPALPVLQMSLLQPPVRRLPDCRPPDCRPPVRWSALSKELELALRIWTTAKSRRHRRRAQRPQSRQQRSAPTCGPAARLKQAQTTVAMKAALRAWRSSMPGQGPDQAMAQVAPAFPVRSPVQAQAQARLPGPEQLPPLKSSILQARTRALAPALVPAQESVQAQAWFPAQALGAARGPGQVPAPELSMVQARAWIAAQASVQAHSPAQALAPTRVQGP